MEKRQRSQNFSENEKTLFLKIMVNYSTTVENKETTNVANKRKEEAWMNITSNFNAATTEPVLRTPEQLKNFWFKNKRKCRVSVPYAAEQQQQPASEQLHAAEQLAKRFKIEEPYLSDNESLMSDISDKSWIVDGQDPFFDNSHPTDKLDVIVGDNSSHSIFEPAFESIGLAEQNIPKPARILSTAQQKYERERHELKMKILEEQRLHNRELQVLEIKLARERLENERLIAVKKVELLKLKIVKENKK